MSRRVRCSRRIVAPSPEKLCFQSTPRSAETGQPKNPAAASMQGSNGESGGVATKGRSEIFSL